MLFVNKLDHGSIAIGHPTLKILPQHPANHKPTCRINMFWLNGVMLGKVGHRARHLGQLVN
jgi:hypothetical protein